MVIIGARGLAKELLQVLHDNGEIERLCFFDDLYPDAPERLYGRFPVIRSLEGLAAHFKVHGPEFALGIGGPEQRRVLGEKAKACGGVLESIIARSATIGSYGTRLAPGVCILTQAIITNDVTLGEGALINKAAIIGHDVTIGNYCEIAPGARVMGRSVIGDLTQIGTNAVVLPDTRIGSHCRVAAGSVVRGKVPDGASALGMPSKVFRR